MTLTLERLRNDANMSDRADWVLDFLKSRGVDPIDVGEAMSAVLDRLVNCEHDESIAVGLDVILLGLRRAERF